VIVQSGAITPKLVEFFFPVNPETISITTPYAVTVTPTLTGVVEENSGPVFYNITISGTTGVSPKRNWSSGVERDPVGLRPTGQDPFTLSENALGGFGASTIAAVNNAVGSILGSNLPQMTGKQNRKTGYTAFHVLYKFIWLYNHAKARGSKDSLWFVNTKDGNRYNVIVQNFQLNRDKSRPNLYNYSIQMKGWNLDDSMAITDTSKAKSAGEDRLKLLGLADDFSIKRAAFRAIEATKTILNTAATLLETAAGDLSF
jgi:uncharacterized DUF497 family protein